MLCWDTKLSITIRVVLLRTSKCITIKASGEFFSRKSKGEGVISWRRGCGGSDKREGNQFDVRGIVKRVVLTLLFEIYNKRASRKQLLDYRAWWLVGHAGPRATRQMKSLNIVGYGYYFILRRCQIWSRFSDLISVLTGE